jgi:hypothetical protein
MQSELDPVLPYEMLSHSFVYNDKTFRLWVYVMVSYDGNAIPSYQVILEDVTGEDQSSLDSIPDDYIESLRKDLENEINATVHRFVNNIQKETTDFFRDVGCVREEYIKELNSNKPSNSDCCSGNSCGCHHGAD